MKKLVLVLFVALVAMSVSAQTIQLGNFPVGQWLDRNYNAIWEFSSNNIRILYPNGVVAHDFSTSTILNFRVFMEGTAPGISFSCPDTGRSYRFIKPLTSGDLVMEIEREGQPSYSVTQRQWTGQLPTPPAQPAAAGGGTLTITNPPYEGYDSVTVYNKTALFGGWREMEGMGGPVEEIAFGNGSSPVTLRAPNNQSFTRSGTFLVVLRERWACMQQVVTFTNGSATVDFKTMSLLENPNG